MDKIKYFQFRSFRIGTLELKIVNVLKNDRRKRKEWSSLFQEEETANVLQKMRRLLVDILPCTEVKHDFWNFYIHYIGENNLFHREGVAIITDKAFTPKFQTSWSFQTEWLYAKLKSHNI